MILMRWLSPLVLAALVVWGTCWGNRLRREHNRKSGAYPQRIGPFGLYIGDKCRVLGMSKISALVWLYIGFTAWGVAWQAGGRGAVVVIIGTVAVVLAFLAHEVGLAWKRHRMARYLVDFFELDEALLPVAKHLYGDVHEPTYVAYEAAIASAYDYIGWVTWGRGMCRWTFSFRADFTEGGWHVPSYPWLRHIGGPALLEVDSEILLVTEHLSDPRPTPVFPGAYFRYPFCERRDGAHALHLWSSSLEPPADTAVQVWIEEEGTQGRVRWVMANRYNSELGKFGRVRYPVLFGLRPQTVTRAQIVVRTRDGLPLEIPQVLVTFDLFASGRVVREARKEGDPQWPHLAWQATRRMMTKEAAHWRIRSATDLAAYVMRSDLDAAFRKVFARYTAAQVLDRVSRETLQAMLQAYPSALRMRLEQQWRALWPQERIISWQRIHDEILEVLNGPAEEGYPLAEARGLLVTQLSFDDWRPPGLIHAEHRKAMRTALALEAAQRPSAVQQRMQRTVLAVAQNLADRLDSTLPAIPEHVLYESGPLLEEEFLPSARRAWIQVLDILVEYLRGDPEMRPLWTDGEIPAETYDPTFLSGQDVTLQRRHVVLWLIEAYQVLTVFPWQGEGGLGKEPGAFLPPSLT